ncbi:DMT family transporter [Qingshengfaniella alkalisoli]|uniref:DMT family transporter n=1 Tax=Qingshengfaniella alkalisoli TaxID=2599296 RepID=A0A5B8IAK6_9RHOB|nr:DMT family transporter [Qingshengfaniella alkalisoli]
MNPFRGIILKLAAVSIFVVMQILVKSVSGTIPPGQSMFFRSLFAMPVIVVWLAFRHELRQGLKTRKPMAHVWRGVVGTCAMGLGFAALGLLPLPEVTAISYATPLLVVMFAAMFLGEDVGLFRFLMVMLGLSGVLIVLSPRLTGFEPGVNNAETLGAIVALLGAICAALAQVFVRNMVRTEDAAAIVFWFSVTATVLSLATIPFGWVVPDPKTAGILIVMGLVGGLGQIFLTSAYRFADASLIAPFDYASMILALAAGYFLFNEVPTPTMLTGASVIIGAGILIIWREHKLQIERGRARRGGVTPQG